nr:MoxR family ATPase [Massiliimalia timonensis]
MMMDIQILEQKLRDNIGLVIKGKDDVIRKIVICLICSGHILLEDVPGTGKTTLAKALARSLDCDFKRVQFTPDLLPSDLTGVNFYNQKLGEFQFKKGALFTNILLGDEINRATPRTQSSLLECMEERQVSVDGQTYPLKQPFLVIATQNPIEIQGTFPLPEAQLDRFFMRLSMGYPDLISEIAMLQRGEEQLLTPVASAQDIAEAQRIVSDIKVSGPVKEYLVNLVNATRSHEKIRLGVSPRGSLALMKAAQALAAIEGRDYVIPDDIQQIALDVLPHRIICKGHNIMQQGDLAKEYLRQIITQTPVPIERR